MVSRAVTDPRSQQPTTEDQVLAVPPELFMRREQSLRFQRNGVIYATDGRVAVLQQVVVEQDAGEVAELVVTVEATGQAVILPATLVEKTGGSAVFLRVDRAQFAEWAGRAPAYEKRRFRKARLRRLRKSGKRASAQNRRQAVAQIGQDFITTPIIARLDSGLATASTAAESRGTVVSDKSPL